VRGNRYAQSLLNRLDHGSVHGLRVGRGPDQDAASRVLVGDLPEPVAQFFVEIAVEALEPIRTRARGGAGEPDFDRQIENHGQIRREIAEGEAV
jgi:hypothetical protein